MVVAVACFLGVVLPVVVVVAAAAVTAFCRLAGEEGTSCAGASVAAFVLFAREGCCEGGGIAFLSSF